MTAARSSWGVIGTSGEFVNATKSVTQLHPYREPGIRSAKRIWWHLTWRRGIFAHVCYAAGHAVASKYFRQSHERLFVLVPPERTFAGAMVRVCTISYYAAIGLDIFSNMTGLIGSIGYRCFRFNIVESQARPGDRLLF